MWSKQRSPYCTYRQDNIVIYNVTVKDKSNTVYITYSINYYYYLCGHLVIELWEIGLLSNKNLYIEEKLATLERAGEDKKKEKITLLIRKNTRCICIHLKVV